ncbi:hypothetical protein EQV77_06190 [Halobacillus fulvus]|nr:hypothetical protein EQV77_06190 [Halobacillus fulvus]
MKTLQVDQVQQGIQETLAELSDVKASFFRVEEAVQAFVQLPSFEGQGGSSIRSFYEECHQPFLLYVKNFLSHYEATLKQMLSSLHHLEPAPNGYLDQAFMEGDLQQGLKKVSQVATSITEEANGVLSGIRDLVSVQTLDGSGVQEEVRRADRYVDETIEKLHTFDEQQVSSLQPVQADMDWMKNYVSIIQSKFMSGTISISQYNSHQLSDLKAYHPVLTSSAAQPFSLETVTGDPFMYTGFNKWSGPYAAYSFNQLGSLQKQTSNSEEVTSSDAAQSESDPYNFVLGDSAQVSDAFSVGAGFGYGRSDWSMKGVENFPSNEQIGGSSQFTALYAEGKWDTLIMSGDITQDILRVEGQASYWGKSFFPLVKAQATGLTVGTRAQYDRDLPYIGDIMGGTGFEAKGTVGDAKAYAGIDNSSVGVAAKAALAEAEVSPIIGIPFTDFNTKFTFGVSAGGIGGEAKLGKENLIDLRFLLGIKVGLSLENESGK